ncbi:hypothetical protein BCV72DRAFT_228663 [Rhizopus microsporus var. microsporus]|uniref:Uncharacterized protein n=2 Tax=Rhizopus microsporus TaxID=58291 RepID=A0A2G4T102_RHIZD|nr:uncharacterized protein RHIMIDRAFT_275938 [Rhizopus microsporus ATCC 52813]ORE06212.1 hypothetical protein BCV72DRAFT_228663 [Rhizopus microsporus var. microsporus]PHZ14693.1 hypothetical protein RHIMIDRAFT_275938 [Rhizopus microsporus ATCC 52813]
MIPNAYLENDRACFDKFEVLEAAVGEPMSITNQKERTRRGLSAVSNRWLEGAWTTNAILRLGHIKYNIAEALSLVRLKPVKYSDSSRHIKDALHKLLQTLRDILDDLIENKPELSGSLQTVGFIHSGLTSIMF